MSFVKPIIWIALCVTGGLFFVRGSQDPAEQVPRDVTVVEYWEKWVGNEADAMKQVVDDFNNTVGKQKHIYVRYMSMAEIDQKTLVAIAGGVPPDIAGLWDSQVAQYAALGAVEPLDEYAAAVGIDQNSYLPVFWNACHYNGHLYGLVSTPGTIALIYNKKILSDESSMLRAAGLDPTQPPHSVAEFDRFAETLDTHDAKGQLDRAGFVPLQSWYVPMISFWFGGNIFDTNTQKFTIDSPATIAAYQWIQSYSRRLGTQSLMDFQNSLGNFDSPQNPFLVGKLVMQQQGPWMANYIRHLKPALSEVTVPHDQEFSLPDRRDNYAWGVAPFPSLNGESDVSYNCFDVMMVPKGALHPREAFEFMAYVNRQDVSEKLNTLQCKNTQLKSVSSDFLAKHPNPYIAVYEKLAASPNAHALPSVPTWPEVVKELNDAAQAVALEGTDPAVVLKAAQQRMQERYEQFRAIEAKRNQAVNP